MPANIGTCALCLSPGVQLQNSHFVSRFLYKLLRQGGAGNPNPLQYTGSGILQTSSQETAYVLCKTCEDLLSKQGEVYVSQVCRRSPTDFKLRDLLHTANMIHAGGPTGTMKAFRPSAIAGLQVNALVYFATSIVWRAAIWSTFRPNLHQANLESHTQESFRLFLLGQAPLPSNVVFNLTVIDDNIDPQDPDMSKAIVFPYRYSHDGIISYRFSVCGLVFQVDIYSPGTTTKTESFFPGDLIVLAPWTDCGIFSDSLGLWKKAFAQGLKGRSKNL